MSLQNTPAIEIRNVSKRYRQQNFRSRCVLENISFKVTAGEVFGFLGPNGAGKTTLIKILVGLVVADQGGAYIQGQPCGQSRTNLKLGYLPENPYFYPFLTAVEFLEFHAKLLGLNFQLRMEKINDLLIQVGLEAFKNQLLKTFSRGMLQRIGLAQAMLHDPEVLILDEPMSGLDPVGRREIRDILNKTAMSGKTVFFSTHIIPDVEVICTTVGYIKNGKLQGSGNIEELLGKTVRSIEIRYILPFNKDPQKMKPLSRSKKTMEGWVLDIEMHEDELEKKVNEVLEFILHEKGVIRSVVPRKSTLEDIFFGKNQ